MPDKTSRIVYNDRQQYPTRLLTMRTKSGLFIVLLAFKIKIGYSGIADTMLQNLIALWYNNTRRKGFLVSLCKILYVLYNLYV